MADDLKNRPIIIKRKKVVAGDGHHGGAWKVAYADFVTAMMAFFMLMWLLNATTEQQRKGIADYFSPNVPIARISGGGEGAFGGESPFSELTAAQMGTGATNRRPTEGRQSLGASGTDYGDQALGDQQLQEANQFLAALAAQDPVVQQALAHLQMRVSDEGLIIEIFSRPDAALFAADGTAGDILRVLAPVLVDLFDIVTNPLALTGHVRAQPVMVAEETRWMRSADQAQQMRILLEQAGFDPQRVVRVTGHADRLPAIPDLMSPRNDRVELILLTRP